MKKLFISGKITGEPIWKCVHKFECADAENMFDYEVINPLMLDGIHFGIEHEKLMEICLNALKECDSILILRDWENSTGANIEHQFAIDNNLEIIYQ